MTHYILTEPSLSLHDRKGREGIRKGMGMDLSQYQSLPTHLGARATRDWSW